MSGPPVLASPLLAAVRGVRHAFFTRDGGVSKGIYASLNLGRGSRDDPADVAENRRRAAAVFGLGPEALNTCYQIHSARVLTADRPWGDERPRGDGAVAARPGLICGALAADCAPVLIADGEARVVAAVHAGWRGALAGVVEAAVEAMTVLGADPARMVAAVGPCIGQASYEVGLEFLGAFEAASPGAGRFFLAGASADKRQFDLPAYVLSRLRGAGVAHCEWIGADTCGEAERFFSNRRAVKTGEGDYGRLLSAIALEP
ncbi:MAG: peptidoglycan editing factor PgeF [Caulobacteraceae bacterium]